MKDGLRVAVVEGGPSAEAEVSRASASAVAAALAQAGHRPVRLELDAALGTRLAAGAFDVAFPVAHGPLGEDGCLQGLLEVLGVAYVGSGVLASALGMEKPRAKALFREAGLPVAPGALVVRGESLDERARELRHVLGAALVVKPSGAGSAIGVTRVRAEEPDGALVAALSSALELGEQALVERFFAGQEVTCGVLDDADGRPGALPPTLILPRAADWYDFTSRYARGGSSHVCPAPLPAPVFARVRQVALGAHRALGARDLSRVDFVVGDGPDADRVTLLELNTLPGMTATSLFPEAAAAAGVPFVALCDRLVRRAHARPRAAPPVALAMPAPVEA